MNDIVLALLRLRSLEWAWQDALKPGFAMKNEDLVKLWAGRPKVKPMPFKSGYAAPIDKRYLKNCLFDQPLIDWRGLI
jgi:hypothetical protein